MIVEDDAISYYFERERAERCLAANAGDEAARLAHLALASEYRRRALSARRDSQDLLGLLGRYWVSEGEQPENADLEPQQPRARHLL